ncbi:hypothetical protein BDK51DRAFT_32648 [Blyttiomyces helicus]|uniref:Peptidase S54 rhomboid domain-containing protein n=1 Tax=Blyttiomyces helicus TaxID=388810 RepID=A0A4P9W2Y8_9FUNG|nr:hypothetical protein BDK51DRAFT_32648 [Blyttiomyces helicus]|eukprot:RKO84970.1 hypothetical protein BDK51DRAFT_32648 [Blyttiomyces helicus]
MTLVCGGIPTRVVSPLYGWITYQFNHVDFPHWAGNIIAIISSGLSLDLGFTPTIILILGGGIAGALAHTLPYTGLPLFRRTRPAPSLFTALLQDTQTLATSILENRPPPPPLTAALISARQPKTLVGASSAAFALLGADLVRGVGGVMGAIERVRGTRAGSWARDREMEGFREAVWVAGAKAVAVVTEVVWILEGGRAWGLSGGGGERIVAHGAHLGGFAFGVVFMVLWEWVVGQGRGKRKWQG